MFKIFVRFALDVFGSTASVSYAFSPNTLIVSSQVNQNFQDLIAVINALTSVNYADDSVTAAKLNGDVVRATYGLIQHTDGSLYVDVSDTNPALELTDGGLRVKVDGATLLRGASGLYIALTSESQGDIMYRNASGWVRLAAGTSGQFLKTLGAAANPLWATIPFTDYRREMYCTQASTTNLSVAPGSLEVNGALISKTAVTTLVLSTASDWAGGASLRATSTAVYVGVDSAGNVKLHTTAPTHSDYGLTITAGTKRYASWSSTTYRIIGWGYMNATGSGEFDSYGVGNMRDGDIHNAVHRVGNADDTVNDNSYGSDLTEMAARIYVTGQRPVVVVCKLRSTNNFNNGLTILADFDGSDDTDSEAACGENATEQNSLTMFYIKTGLSQGVHLITIQGLVAASSDVVDGVKVLDVYEM